LNKQAIIIEVFHPQLFLPNACLEQISFQE